MSFLSYSQNMPIYFASKKYKLSIHSFLEYCYTIVLVHDILCPSNESLVHDSTTNMHKIFSALNLTIICIRPFTCNNTIFSVSFLNEIFLRTPLRIFFYLSTPSLTAFKTDRTLTD